MICFGGADMIDDAVNSRLGAKIPVWIPGAEERREQLVRAFTKAVDQKIAEPTVLQPGFINTMVEQTRWRSYRTITGALKKTWNEPFKEMMRKVVRSGSNLHRKITQPIPLVTQAHVRAAFADTESSYEVCRVLSAWAHHHRVEVDAYVSPELRFPDDQLDTRGTASMMSTLKSTVAGTPTTSAFAAAIAGTAA